MQEEVDERQLLGQHGTGVYQVPHQRLPSQAGKSVQLRVSVVLAGWVKTLARWFCGFRIGACFQRQGHFRGTNLPNPHGFLERQENKYLGWFSEE